MYTASFTLLFLIIYLFNNNDKQVLLNNFFSFFKKKNILLQCLLTGSCIIINANSVIIQLISYYIFNCKLLVKQLNVFHLEFSLKNK